MSQTFEPGQRLSYDGHLCTVGYVGEVAGTNGTWLGVEWDDPSRGKHHGEHKGTHYFTCKSKSPTAASFVRPTRPLDPARTFVAAVREKYASEVTADHVPVQSGREIVISGKIAEEVGFDKIRRKLAQLSELKYVILDSMRVAYEAGPDDGQSIGESCPRIAELDLSRNLFTELGTVVKICEQLEDLRSLRLNGNRFQNILVTKGLQNAVRCFAGIKDLAVEETLMTWEEICHLAGHFETLTTLHASTNQLSSLTTIHPSSPMISTLTSLGLEYNDFAALTDLAPLAALSSLRNLHLKGNNISSITSEPSAATPSFAPSLQYVDISYNQISTWAFVDALPSIFPGLTSLRFAHNPIYDNPTFDPETTTSSTTKTTVTEEAYMITVARLAQLKSLNFSTITPTDRTNAEMFYLGRIGRQLASVPEGATAAEEAITAQHLRYAELCDLYGEPVVVRKSEVNPAFLEARLVAVEFRFVPSGGAGAGQEAVRAGKRTVSIPRTFDIYAVKGIAGKLFGLPPLGVRLVWETGEWDPVAGFDEEVGDSSEEEEEKGKEEEEKRAAERKGGRWVKREVELKDSPRQFGFCVDGSEATIRVELRPGREGDPSQQLTPWSKYSGP